MELQRYHGNFEKCLAQLAVAKQKQATTKQVMQYRIEQGADSDACQKGFWGSENFNVIDGRIYGAVAEFNPLIPYANQAVNAHAKGSEFYLTDKVLLNGKPASQVLKEIAKQDSKKPVSKKRVLDLGQAQTHNVPTDSFADDNGIAFLARNKTLANQYGLFLKDKAGITQVTFYLPPIQSKDYARGFWLCRLGGSDRSDFNGDGRSLGDDGGSLFGVRRVKGAEGAQFCNGIQKSIGIAGLQAAQKNSGVEMKVFPYTEEQLKSYLETAKGIREGKLGSLQAGKLEELVLGLKQFLKK